MGRLNFSPPIFHLQRQILRMAAEIRERTDRLYVLIKSAGIFKKERELTEDGLEMTFVVNHLAPFLLTNLLLDLIKQSAPARIINASSMTHQQAWLNFDNLQGEKRYNGHNACAVSKLDNILFTYELAERLEGSGVTVNCLHPGVINTRLLRAGYRFAGAKVEKGARTVVYLASSPEVEGITGAYFRKAKAVSSSPSSYDISLRKKFREISKNLTGLS